MIRPIRHLLVLSAALLSIFSFAGAQESQVKKPQAKHTGPVSGAQLFKHSSSTAQCATGTGGRGDGPVASALMAPTPDLTTLAQRHEGKVSG